MQGASQLRAAADGGPLRGGAPRAVWLTAEADPRTVSARSAAERLIKLGRPPHLVWNPVAGEIVQLVPIVRAGCMLGCPEGLRLAEPPGTAAGWPAELPAGAGPPEPGPSPVGLLDSTNAEGRRCVQIAVVAYAWDPFTSGPMTGLKPILDWLDSWQISRHWPAGPPEPFPYAIAARRDRRLWARGGHFGASQVPCPGTSGPGALDITRLTGCEFGIATRPAPPAREARPAPAALAERPGRRAAAGGLDDLLAAPTADRRGPLSRAS
jgi:hypothetical protein